jgi:preprotein translocase subunit SecG
MILLLTVLIALVSLALILIILVQNPKGGGLNSAFGGSQAASNYLGAANATNTLETTTWSLATALLVLCLITGVVFKPGATDPNAKYGVDVNSTTTTAPVNNSAPTPTQ